MSRRVSSLAALLLTLAVLPMAQAQFSGRPFFDQAEPLRHAFALQLVDARLIAVEALISEAAAGQGGTAEAETNGAAGELAADLSDEILAEDLPLVAGSLALADDALLGELEEQVAELAAVLAEADADITASAGALLADIRASVTRARELLLPTGATEDPLLVAAVISLLLLSEEGVAERYEEAVAEDPDAYPLGWAVLQSVHDLWSRIAVAAEERLRVGIDEALAELDRLFPGPRPPAALTGDPEDAEEPAHRIVALLERVSDAQLYPDRDLGGLARQVGELAASGCEDLGAGRQRLGTERVRAAAFGYGYLGDLAGLLEPEAHEQAELAFASLAAEDVSPEASCGDLRDALERLRVVVGG